MKPKVKCNFDAIFEEDISSWSVIERRKSVRLFVCYYFGRCTHIRRVRSY